MVNKGDEYTCGCCGGTFVAERSHDEAMDEYRETFGDTLSVGLAVVCDGCYRRMIAEDPPGYWQEREAKRQDLND